ncbi:MAG: L,D-transpeptidase family protein [Phycisphaeraceae bacterium]|nr:L,D-transpeptidase family protein [Phycisphaeraceae bacterium]
MSLPSQSSAGRGGRSFMYRRKRHHVPIVLVVLGVVGITAAAVFAFRVSGDQPPQRDKPERDTPEILATNVPPPAATRSTPKSNDSPRGKAGSRDRAAPTTRQTSTPADGGPLTLAIDQARQRPTSEQGAARGADDSPVPPEPRAETPADASQPATTQHTRSSARRALDEAELLIAKNDLLAARTVLNRELRDGNNSAGDARSLREALAAINERLVFSPTIVPGDPMSEAYRIASGDVLVNIVKRHDLGVDWRLIQKVNALSAPERIRAGNTLKLVRGPFHAVVKKREYRLDLYWGPADSPRDWLYIRSFPVGLGEGDSTPIGVYQVKLCEANPAWTNPRTGERFSRSDPKNPIGEFWVGLEGLGDAAVHTGYGLHGTIDPDSIGQQQSMGCVRMLPEDIELVFSAMKADASIVRIEP